MSGDDVNPGRRRFLTAATTVVGGVGVGFALVPFISSMQPSAKARAAGAPVRADISKLEPGQMIRVKWRGKPVFIRHRTAEEIEALSRLGGCGPADMSYFDYLVTNVRENTRNLFLQRALGAPCSPMGQTKNSDAGLSKG